MRNRLELLAARGLARAPAPAQALACGLALVLGLGCIAAPNARAATMTVALNHSARLALAGPAASVVVGNPDIADVTVVDSRTVFVSGRGPGSTDVAVLDPLGRTLFSGEVLVSSQAGAHVIVHRGIGGLSDMACDPMCVAVKAPANGKAGAAPVNPLGAPPTLSEAASNGLQVVPVATTTTLFTTH